MPNFEASARFGLSTVELHSCDLLSSQCFERCDLTTPASATDWAGGSINCKMPDAVLLGAGRQPCHRLKELLHVGDERMVSPVSLIDICCVLFDFPGYGLK